MMFLGTLRFIMPSLESSWCILAHYDLKTDPKTDPKIDPKWTQNETRICSIFGLIFEHFFTILGGHFGVKNPTAAIAPNSKSVVLQWDNYIFCKNDMIFM